NGEGPSVSAAEKLAVLRALSDAPVPVIPTVAEANLPDTLALLGALEDVDAAAGMVLPPYFFQPASPEGLLDFSAPAAHGARRPGSPNASGSRACARGTISGRSGRR